jgi:choice-of-anchor A domain-containing protein
MTLLMNYSARAKTRRVQTSRECRLNVEQLEGREVPASGLGIAGDFSAFVLHNANLYWSDIAGRAAVGGNATFSSYAIGDSLTNSLGARDDLIVGGNLQFTNGQVFNGNVVYGGTGTFSSFGHPNGTIRQGSVINFGSAETQLDSLSDQYAAMTANGSVQSSYGTITLTGTKTGVNVFKLTATQLSSAGNLIIKAPAGSSVIVNVSGANAHMQYMGMTVQGTTSDHVLLNFNQATNLTLAGIAVLGSVLAPRATVDFSNGNLTGTLVAGSWSGYGHITYQPPEINPPASTTSVLTGVVYFDQSRDGMPQTGEPGLSGVTVNLWGTDTLGNPVYQSITTDANGAFNFSNLNAGTYSIVVIAPSGYLPGHSMAGSFGGTANWNLVTAITVPSGATSSAYNFGMVTPSP